MKTYIYFFVAALASITVAEFVVTGELKDISEKCVVFTGVAPDIVTRAFNDDFVEDEKLMNFCTCVLQKRGGQNPDGSFNRDVMKVKVSGPYDKEKAFKAIDKCTKTDATTPAKAAYDHVKCFISTMLNTT